MLTDVEKIRRERALDDKFSERPFEQRHMMKRRPAHGYGTVRCDGCGKGLDYEYGSIAWGCNRRDLCPSCWATEASTLAADAFGKSLREALAGRAALAETDGGGDAEMQKGPARLHGGRA